MRKPFKFIGLVFCFLSITLAGNVLAIRSEEMLENRDEQADQSTEEMDSEKDCHLFFLKRNLGLQVASKDAGDPIDILHLFIADADGKIIKNAQVVTNIIDQQGNQQLSRALPFKGGYILATDHLSTGQYRVEAEIVTRGQLLTDEFRFNKA